MDSRAEMCCQLANHSKGLLTVQVWVENLSLQPSLHQP